MEAEKTILITGCSSGIGKELCTALLARGYRVIATLRNKDAREALFREDQQRFAGRLTVAELDVTSAADRSALVTVIEQQFEGKLWGLINNAGFGLAGAIEEATEEQIQRQFDINVLGLISTTQQFLPYLRSVRGRLINISSVLGYSGLPYYGLYAATKHALEAISETLYFELAPLGVQVAVVEPGAHETKFGENLVWGERKLSPNPYGNRARQFREAIHARMKNRLQPSANVVLAICDLLEMKRMRFRTRVGYDAQLAYLARRLLPNRLLMPLLSRYFASV